MDALAAFSKWFPDRTPTWIDVGIGILAFVTGALNLFNLETFSWEWVAVGFVVFAVVTGPLATSFVGEQVGDWFRSIGVLGRLTVILLFVIGVGIIGQVFDIPRGLVSSFVGGGMLAIGVFVLLSVLDAGEVSGWRPE